MNDIILPEVASIGIYAAPTSARAPYTTKSRSVTMFELELPCEVGGRSYINGESADITPELIILSKPGDRRHTLLPYKCYYIHMMLAEGALCERLMRLPHYISLEPSGAAEKIFRELCDLSETARESDRMLIAARILELIYMLSAVAEEQQAAAGKSGNDAISAVIKYIKSNLTADLSLAKMAEYASFSPIHFHNSFKRAVGKTLREFVEQERIRRAVTLLTDTELTLAQIAYECGFSSQSYFSSAFKRRMGTTPRRYAAQAAPKHFGG